MRTVRKRKNIPSQTRRCETGVALRMRRVDVEPRAARDEHA